MNSPIEIRKIIGSVILSILWICTFLFIPSRFVIDWNGSGQDMTSLQLFIGFIGLLVILFYHIFYRSTSETNKLSWTVVLTVAWLALIIFFPFKNHSPSSGAVGFFALIGGLAVVVLWVRFFSDELIA